jgi:hypothetical protein
VTHPDAQRALDWLLSEDFAQVVRGIQHPGPLFVRGPLGAPRHTSASNLWSLRLMVLRSRFPGAAFAFWCDRLPGCPRQQDWPDLLDFGRVLMDRLEGRNGHHGIVLSDPEVKVLTQVRSDLAHHFSPRPVQLFLGDSDPPFPSPHHDFTILVPHPHPLLHDGPLLPHWLNVLPRLLEGGAAR